jgi:hypothetical protein
MGVTYSDRVGRDRAFYQRTLGDGTKLFAYVMEDDGRPRCDEIKIQFGNGARNVGRELAINELEHAINNSDQHGVRDAKTGRIIPLLALSDVPHGVPVRGSRVRPNSWPDDRLAALVRDLENGESLRWHLSRRRERELARKAVDRGLAERGETDGRKLTWKLTPRGQTAASRHRR